MTSLPELARIFFRLGATSFGGPAAHVAMMEDEVVRHRGWMTRQKFLDLWGATNLIPGPNSTEMAIHIGREQAGWPGLVVAGAAFILPAAVMVTAIAWGYARFGALPRAEALLYGIKPVVIAIVARAIWGLARTAARNRLLAVMTLACIVASFAGWDELVILLAAGAVAMGCRWIVDLHRGGREPLRACMPVLGGVATAATGVSAFGLWPLFLFFLKVGSVLFGSGYVLLAFLRSGLVERLHWLTEGQLLDAIAVGQITPGPVFTTATFVGYILGGLSGAAVATLGIFLPAFVFVAISGPLVTRIRRSPAAGAFLDGVNAASLALMTVVTVYLARNAVHDIPTAVLAVMASLVLFTTKWNSAWLVAGGGAAGLLLHALR